MDFKTISNELTNYIELSPEICKDGVDTIFEGIKEISTEIKGIKAILKLKDVPSKLFCSKFEKFLLGSVSINQTKRKKFVAKYNRNLMNVNCERLLSIIDKIEDVQKIDYLVKLFEALVYEKIDVDMFFRLSNVLTQIIKEDLELFLNEDKLQTLKEHDCCAEMLVSIGLLKEKRKPGYDGATFFGGYHVSALGKQMKEVFE